MDFKASKKYTLPLRFMAASNVVYQCAVFVCYMREGECGLGEIQFPVGGLSSGHSCRL